MRRPDIYLNILCMAALLMVAGCGGGGTDGASGVVAHTSIAAMKLSTQGTFPPNTAAIAGVTVTINLPKGVSVRSIKDTNGNEQLDITPSGVVSGKGEITTIYSPPTSTAAGKVSLALVSKDAAGFGTGEFATVTCEASANALPKATDFTLADANITGLDYSTLTTLSVTFTADIR